jgi:hypothetical protein
VVPGVGHLAALTATSAYAQGVSRPVAVQIQGNPDAVAGKLAWYAYTERCNQPVREDILDANLFN